MWPMTQKQQADLLAQACRHEALGAALRELAICRRPSDDRLAAAPVIHGWRWDAETTVALHGTWQRDGERGVVDGRVGMIFANLPDMSAVLTLDGWVALGVPDEVRAPTSGAVQ